MHKILNVISDTNIGGAGKLLLIFLANFKRDEFDISVVLPKGSKLIEEINKLSIPTIEIDGISDKSMGLAAIKRFRALYKENAPAIVHTHAALSARIAAKLMGVKVVHPRHSVHTSQHIAHEPFYKKRFPYKHVVGALNNFFSDTIIATSPVAKMSMVETGTSQKKTIMVYNGINALKPANQQTIEENRKKYGIKENDFVCGIIARLEEVKDHDTILKAAQMLQRQDSSIKFLIVGIGSQETRLKKMAANMELDNCIFTGFISNVADIFGIIDLQLNASRTETTNLALLEGLSLGIPAVASDCAGNPYVINDGVNGVLFEQGDYMALTKAIISLRNNEKELQHLGKRAKEVFADKFDSKVMTRCVEDIYRKLLGTNAKSLGTNSESESESEVGK